MIPQNKAQWQTPDWQTALKRVITDPRDLALRLGLPMDSFSSEATQSFGLKVPESMLSRMETGNPDCPILKQFLPSLTELENVPGYFSDPLHEKDANPLPGLIQKFENRVLLTLTGHCAVHCRYCFRRHFAYDDNQPGKRGFETVYQTITENKALAEVIWSGGDPLSLPDEYLRWHIEQLNQIDHIKVLRMHTRMPIVLPERITDDFIDTLKQCKKKMVMVVHCNHPNEINADVEQALGILHEANIMLYNQSVLLKNINDNVEALRELSWRLFENHVQPYYLHVFDKVAGAHHFDCGLDASRELYAHLRAALPGYLVPQLVQEVPGEKAKRPV